MYVSEWALVPCQHHFRAASRSYVFHLLTLFLNSFSLLIERQSSCHLLQKEDDPLIPAGQLDHTLLDAILSTAEGCIGHRQVCTCNFGIENVGVIIISFTQENVYACVAQFFW